MNINKLTNKLWVSIGIVFAIGFVLIFLSLSFFAIRDMKTRTNGYPGCLEKYPLNSCELYKCRANYSMTTTSVDFNMRNYEICKIILNKNMTFNESLPLLKTIKNDNQQ